MPLADLSLNNRSQSISETASLRRWHWLYYALAAFEVLTISVSLYLSHRVANDFSQAVSNNSTWTAKLPQYAALTERAYSVKMPAYDVLRSLDVAHEQSRRQQALKVFDELLVHAREDLQGVPQKGHSQILLAKLDAVAQAMQSVTRLQDEIFAQVRRGEVNEAASKISNLNIHSAHATKIISGMVNYVEQVCLANLSAQVSKAQLIRRLEYIITAMILALVTAVTMYGIKVSREVKRSHQQLQKSLLETRKETERANQALADANSLRQAIDNHMLVSVTNLAGKVIDVNEPYCELSGYSRDELIGNTHRMERSDYHPGSFWRQMWSKISTGQPWRAEVCNRAKDGSEYWVDSTIIPWRGPDGTVDRYLSLRFDISDRKQAEEELRKLSIAVEQSPVSIIIMDSEGRIEYANPTFANTSGYSLEEVTGKRPKFFNSPSGRRAGDLSAWETLSSGRVWQCEFLSRKKSGERYWESITVSPIRNAQGVISHYLAISQDITDHKQMGEQLENLAFTDSLTGLPNRRSILQTIQEAIDDDHEKRFALLFLDFDRFKLINDSLGHEAGDELLRQISQRLCRNIRANDRFIPGRLGGDEFVILIRGLLTWDEAPQMADRLLSVFAESYEINDQQVHSTASIGIVTSEHKHETAEDMLRDADLAMYEAKAAGKACCVLFDRSMHERAQSRLQLECELRDAIKQQTFCLYYQPIVCLKTGRFEAVESLVRWEHPERGIIMPEEFIPVAEETGLILPLGSWVIEEACRQLAEWRVSLGEAGPQSVHVNVSRLEMLQPGMAGKVRSLLDKYDLPPSSLHLEVTESMIMSEPDTIVAVINDLRSLGVKIDMDDFGTGYSSLSCLHEFPIDLLKIDRSFINNQSDLIENFALLHGILTLADNLNLRVVAEGIETLEQLATVQSMGCDLGQGFFFAKPLTPNQLEGFIAQGVYEPNRWNRHRGLLSNAVQ